MADVLVSAVLETILGLLSSAALQEIRLLSGFKDELNHLETTLTTIQLVLQDAETKQRKSQAIHNWLRKLKNAAYDAENILDMIAIRRGADSERGMQHQLKSFLSRRNPMLFRLRMMRQVRNVRRDLHDIADERLKFHLGEGVVENHRFGETLESRRTSSLVNESEIHGRREEKEMIMAKLFGCNKSDNRDDLSVYAIQGMGGLGKTTLAQVVYNDERTARHFELRIWVCVSDDFSIEGILRAILESVEGAGCSIFTLDPLQRRLQEVLKARRFLLVLDDVWNENHRLWDGLKQVLRCGSKGSVLMVTTRIDKVALMMADIGVHHLGFLSEEDSWSLFRNRAFPSGEGEENLVPIGKTIVKKCGGVPLAIKALGSLMRYKSNEREWLSIKESEIWLLRDDQSDILPALRLSYDNLLPQMRQCFAYCSIFPKDCFMEENQLIQLWMANGYLPSNGNTDVCLTGRLIFKELVWRSFFQDVEINRRGNMTCKMHDLMHDLATSVMRHETYILEHGKVFKMPKSLRHLSFDTRLSWEYPDKKSNFNLLINDSLRSIIVHGGEVSGSPEGFSSFLSKQNHLRALDSNYYIIENLPNLICKLEQLRYLVISCHNIKRLPESLTRLQKLQTLKLMASEELLELPKRLRVMKNLCFLEVEHFHSLLCTPPGLSELSSLRMLSIFIVGEDASQQINQLKELNLEGKLSIRGLDNVGNLEDAKSANLLTKKNLTSLSLFWAKGIIKNSAERYEEVLQGLQPPQNLEEICLYSYQGTRFPNWMYLAFKNLKKISLEHCKRCEHLPPLGILPSLTHLGLRVLDSVKHLDVEWYGDGEILFPALTSLSIIMLPNLENWTIPDSKDCFPCLNYLEISCCPKLTGFPNIPTLRSLCITSGSMPLLRSITFLTSLTSLVIFGFDEFHIFPDGLLQNNKSLENLQLGGLPIRTLSNALDNLSSLKTLSLDACSNLESLVEGLHGLNSLERLNISGCDGLVSFPANVLDNLPSLESLSFQNCKKLKPLSGSVRRAPPLRDLLLNGLPELEYLPESLQLLSTISELRIWLCKGLQSLPNWLSNLEVLSDLRISVCDKLKSLPDGFKGHKSLRRLDIRGCPNLMKRCRKPRGEDWPKISHIPLVCFNGTIIQRLDQ